MLTAKKNSCLIMNYIFHYYFNVCIQGAFVNKKIFLLLLLSTTHIFSMFIPRKKTHLQQALPIIQQNATNTEQCIYSAIITKQTAVVSHQAQAEKFLNTIFDKKFDEIKNSFSCLSKQVRHEILALCGDAKPILLMAHLPHEQRVEVASHILDCDKESAEKFCSSSIKDALDTYTYAVKKAQWHSLKLPANFYYRANDETLQLLTNAIAAQDKKYSLTAEEFEQLELLLAKEKWLTEKLGLKSVFIYKDITTDEKFDSLSSAIQLLNVEDIGIAFGVILAIINSPIIVGSPVLLFDCIHKAIFDRINILPNLFRAISEYNSVSIPCGFAFTLLTLIYNIHNNYKNNIDFLFERKKQYLS